MVALLRQVFSNDHPVATGRVLLCTHKAKWFWDLRQPLNEQIARSIQQTAISLLPIAKVSENVPQFNKRKILNVGVCQ